MSKKKPSIKELKKNFDLLNCNDPSKLDGKQKKHWLGLHYGHIQEATNERVSNDRA